MSILEEYGAFKYIICYALFVLSANQCSRTTCCFTYKCVSFNNYVSLRYIQLDLGNKQSCNLFWETLLGIYSFCCYVIVFVCLFLCCWELAVDSSPHFFFYFLYLSIFYSIFVNKSSKLIDYTNASSASITKTCLYNFDPLKPHFYIVKLGFTGVYIIFHISAQNIDCGYSLEPPRRGGSNEYPQSMFWAEIWKISEFLYLKIFSFWRWKFLYIWIGMFRKASSASVWISG